MQHGDPTAALDPTLMQVVSAQAKALPPGPDLASLKRTLPYGNDLGEQRRRHAERQPDEPGNEERRNQKRRGRRPKPDDRTVPGPF